MASKLERSNRKKKHQTQKRRNKYIRIIKKYSKESMPFVGGSDYTDGKFHMMLAELNTLNVKYLQILLNDLKSDGAILPWYGDYHKMLQASVETSILERTLLK